MYYHGTTVENGASISLMYGSPRSQQLPNNTQMEHNYVLSVLFAFVQPPFIHLSHSANERRTLVITKLCRTICSIRFREDFSILNGYCNGFNYIDIFVSIVSHFPKLKIHQLWQINLHFFSIFFIGCIGFSLHRFSMYNNLADMNIEQYSISDVKSHLWLPLLVSVHEPQKTFTWPNPLRERESKNRAADVTPLNQ